MNGGHLVGGEKARGRTLIRSGTSTTLHRVCTLPNQDSDAQTAEFDRRIAIAFMLDLRSFHTTIAPKLRAQILWHVQQHFARAPTPRVSVGPTFSGYRYLLSRGEPTSILF